LEDSPPPIKYDRNGDRKTVNKRTTTKYTGDMPSKLLAVCAEGGTPIEFCAQERIDKNTLNAWCENYPEMMQARTLGKVLAEAWWLKQAKDYLVTHGSKEFGTTKFDSNLYKFYVGGRFGHSGDKALRDFIDEMNKRFDSIPQASSAVAAEPEFTEEEEPK